MIAVRLGKRACPAAVGGSESKVTKEPNEYRAEEIGRCDNLALAQLDGTRNLVTRKE